MYAALLAGRTDANDDAEVASGTQALVTHQRHATSGTPGTICTRYSGRTNSHSAGRTLSRQHCKETPLPNFYSKMSDSEKAAEETKKTAIQSAKAWGGEHSGPLSYHTLLMLTSWL